MTKKIGSKLWLYFTVIVFATVSVNLQQNEDALIVCIADHGDGLDEETKKHIFEKFYQGDSSRKSEENGPGLALVKRILDLCKGTVLVESAPQMGAAFSVKLRKPARQ